MESTVRTTVRILPNERNVPPGKLADAEVHFTGGELDGLKLIGFAVWQRRLPAPKGRPGRGHENFPIEGHQTGRHHEIGVVLHAAIGSAQVDHRFHFLATTVSVGCASTFGDGMFTSSVGNFRSSAVGVIVCP